MKLLVMGAGYVGMAFLKHFRSEKEPHEIFITTTDVSKVEALKAYADHVIGLSSLEKTIDACDAMIILVAPNNSKTYEETYLGTAKRVTAALQGRTKPFYIVYTSSTSVCEGAEGEWIFEETKLCPRSDNAKVLLETEKVYLESGVGACILRLGGIYGPGREIKDRAQRFAGKEMSSSGEEATNHVHLDDIVGALEFCLKNRLRGIYHLVNDSHPSRKELYGRFCTESPIWVAAATSFGYKVSNQKIKQAGFILQCPNL